MFTEYNYTIPAHMVCAIEYGDMSGLSDSDEKVLNVFIDSLPKGNRCLSFEVFTEFTNENDVLGRIGCDCVEATLTLFEETEL